MEASQIQRKTKDGPQARRLCQTANLWRIKILAQWCRSRHDEPPGFAMLNLTRLHLGIAHESQFQGLGISAFTRVFDALLPAHDQLRTAAQNSNREDAIASPAAGRPWLARARA